MDEFPQVATTSKSGLFRPRCGEPGVNGALQHETHLVQRLRRPFPQHHVLGKDNPFAFGGGYRNGGLSDEAMDLLRGIWSFDYMGSAEFEFGAVPEALQRLAKAKLTAFTFAVPLAEVPANWRDKSKASPVGDATIYVLCPAEMASAIEERIGLLARNKVDRLKESTQFSSALRPVEEWDSDVCGWLELDNGFLFFTDREMWSKACELFGVATDALALKVGLDDRA